jgi:hypothetical protein
MAKWCSSVRWLPLWGLGTGLSRKPA